MPYKLPPHLSVSHIWPSLEISSPCLKAVPPSHHGCVELLRAMLAPFGCLLRQSPLPKGRQGLFLHTSDAGDLTTTSKRKEKLHAADNFASALFFTRISSVAPSKRLWSGIAFTARKTKHSYSYFPLHEKRRAQKPGLLLGFSMFYHGLSGFHALSVGLVKDIVFPAKFALLTIDNNGFQGTEQRPRLLLCASPPCPSLALNPSFSLLGFVGFFCLVPSQTGLFFSSFGIAWYILVAVIYS